MLALDSRVAQRERALRSIEMSAYRFCRTDDIQLLVDALNHCWAPYFPDEPPMTPVAFKRSIRDLQVWCSSCMVAFVGGDPIGVLIGAKRPSATLIHRIAVHPDHVCQGHGRHLLDSLASKLAILGPPRIVAEVPESLAAARGLFRGCGYTEEAVLTDYVAAPEGPARTAGQRIEVSSQELPGRFVIPVTIDDLEANGLLADDLPGAWEHSAETLRARKAEVAGLAIASDERIEAYILYIESEILALRSLVADNGARLVQLVSRVQALGIPTMRFSKVHPAELSQEIIGKLGFRPVGSRRLFATNARP
jgi:ribosomal protein S18 acetylase RimI-like enzyme